MTGSISQSSSEPNPAIVVNAAYRQGLIMKRTVSRMSFRCSVPGLLYRSSRYLTIRWIVIAIVMISCKDMKLEDITVTSQPNIPNSPIMEIADKEQQSIGNKIQRFLLKIMLKVKIKKHNKKIKNLSMSIDFYE